jgi:hypothetical protein
MIRPMLKRSYPDRSNDSQLALEADLQELIDKASEVGWERTEAMAAIANLVIKFMVADAERKHVNYCIAHALGRVEH